MIFPTKPLVWLVLLPAATAAQTPDLSATEAGIEEIQVTATRRAQSVSDTSAAITLIPSEEIAALKLTTDALAAQTGIFLQQTTPGQGAAILRGLKGSELLHLVDGMRLNNAIFRNAPTQYLALVAPTSVTRMEVVRGASTSLYGSDAVGGVVQVISRVPQFDSETVDWRGDVITAFDTGELGKSLGATIETGTNALAGLFSASYLDTGNRRSGSGERIVPSAYTSKSARFAVSYTPDSQHSLLIDYQYAAQPDTPRVDELLPGYGQTEPSSAEFRFSPNERRFAHIRYMQLDGLLSANWRLDAGWQQIVDDRVTRNFASPARRHESNQSELAGLSLSATRETQFGSWIAGAEYYYDTVNSRRIETDLLTDITTEQPSRFPDGSTVRQAALFANVSYEVSDRNTLVGGARVTSVDVDLPATPVSDAASIQETGPSGDLGWIFDLSDTWQLVTNLSYGFRAPNVFDVGTLGERPGNRFNIPNPDLKFERITHYDVGLRYQSQHAEAEFVLYQLHYNDRITSVSTGDITPDGRDVVQSRNQETADIRGAEVGASLRISPIVTTDIVLNYTWGEQSDGPGDRIPPLNGRVTARADYDALSFSASLIFADRQDRLSNRDIRDPRIDPNGTAGWGILNLRADWLATDQLRTTLRLDNILDKQYRTHGSGLDAVGRSAVVELQYRW